MAHTNCSEATNALDINQDTYVDVNEILLTFSNAIGFNAEKAYQINCSFASYCVD